jgi:16S rRNA C967 or C1407 C5-methylase (RsmB/RsmF family)
MGVGGRPCSDGGDARDDRAAGDGQLPPFFLEALEAQYDDPDDVARVVEGCHARRAFTLRVNALKSTLGEVTGALDGAGIAHEPVPWSPEALVLPGVREDAVRALDVYGQGKVYLQSLSAQVPALVLDPRAGQDILDMAAAPGGKTTQIAALTGGGAHITACEMNGGRADRLEHNLRLQGATNVTVMRMDARRLDDLFSFDRVLLDAPCSGSGTLGEGGARTRGRFTRVLVDRCVRTQTALLAKALRLAKPGSTVVYSTCSVLREENEGAIERARRGPTRFRVLPIDVDGLGMRGLPLLPTSVAGTLQICPTGLYEGFFVARLQRL